uniref:CRAL-TRIO domain-containing protein n=1 Tax=Mucochytrium quahogii TaxID=96639 RepID=A0A7S2RZ26_9STRA|mmetsp:Transcript_31657/g.50561  ORF Transcript_31657/g.50561 Transcript_31657/m.50561 type:complete len:596 (+) Transcript_31657:547-2334(+)
MGQCTSGPKGAALEERTIEKREMDRCAVVQTGTGMERGTVTVERNQAMADEEKYAASKQNMKSSRSLKWVEQTDVKRDAGSVASLELTHLTSQISLLRHELRRAEGQLEKQVQCMDNTLSRKYARLNVGFSFSLALVFLTEILGMAWIGRAVALIGLLLLSNELRSTTFSLNASRESGSPNLARMKQALESMTCEASTVRAGAVAPTPQAAIETASVSETSVQEGDDVAATSPREDGQVTTASVLVKENNEGHVGSIDNKHVQIASVPTMVNGEKYNELIIAEEGNGKDEALSEDELAMVDQLFERVADAREKLEEGYPKDIGFCDRETCRRYLVARQWDLKKAEAQLRKTLQWRLVDKPAALRFQDSPKPLLNPWAMSMRVIGCDKGGRPICYTCFAESNERYDVDANLMHMTLLMEACQNLIRERRRDGHNTKASERQWVWVIDFDGFGFRDQSPKSAIVTAKLMENYPEMLHCGILISVPWVFNATWKLVSGVLDERVTKKVVMANKNNLEAKLKERLGDEATKWVLDETRDSKEKRKTAKSNGPKKYWEVPSSKDQHDSRGLASYVHSKYYIKTPGDAYEEAKAKEKKLNL